MYLLLLKGEKFLSREIIKEMKKVMMDKFSYLKIKILVLKVSDRLRKC